MGRKPNQLILEFFERGPKLEDASNRYQHTCRSCGEKFPKGRIDSLTNHLVKKCPALPLRDRQRAALQLHQLPVPELPDNGPISNRPFIQYGPRAEPTHSPKQNMSALETLAEVSRRHMALTGKPVASKDGRMSPSHNNSAHTGGSFEEFIVQDDKPSDADASLAERLVEATFAATSLPSIQQYGSAHEHTPGSPHLPGLSITQNVTPAATMSQSPLVMAATAANELIPNNNIVMEPELGSSNVSTSDKFFHGRHSFNWSTDHNNVIDPLLQDPNQEQPVEPDESTSKAAAYPRPIAMNPHTNQTVFTTDFSMNPKPSKPRVRGRFSDTRRKEVQEVRKRGACIRCRMLKKPCSGENPCTTCRSVESARLWKQPCIRTRIAEEFTLYSAGLHTVLAFHSVNAAKGQVHLEPVPGRIEATHYLDSSTFATFAVLKGRKLPNSAIDPVLLNNSGLASSNQPDIEILDFDTDDIGGKLEQYMRKLALRFHDSEASSFMRPTIAQAIEFSTINKDGLISRCLELWTATQMLVDGMRKWHIFFNPSLPPVMGPVIVDEEDMEMTASGRESVTSTEKRDSYNLIIAQLMGATEKRAASLAKTVMNDLERRLLQRQQANPFETFIVAVILLSCVERMCWYFKTWESSNMSSQSQQQEFKLDVPATIEAELALAAALQSQTSPDEMTSQQRQQPTPRAARWPLDKQPAHYSQQGERFSDILHMLLRMRGIPPKTSIRPEDGILVATGDNVDETAKQWFEAISVTNELLNERTAARFEGNNSGEWDLKFVGKILGAGVQ